MLTHFKELHTAKITAMAIFKFLSIWNIPNIPKVYLRRKVIYIYSYIHHTITSFSQIYFKTFFSFFMDEVFIDLANASCELLFSLISLPPLFLTQALY